MLNQSRIPEDWEGWDGTTVHHGPDPQVVVFDPNVTHGSGNGSVKMIAWNKVPPRNIRWRELNAWGIPVKPGDHVVFSVWIKSDPSTVANPRQGAFMGVDLYGSSGRIWEVAPSKAGGGSIATDFQGLAHWNDYLFVPYGTSGWTKVYIDFIVPDKVFTVNSEGNAVPPQKVEHIALILAADPEYDFSLGMSQQQNASVWFADAELYVNPDEIPAVPPYAKAVIGASGSVDWQAGDEPL